MVVVMFQLRLSRDCSATGLSRVLILVHSKRNSLLGEETSSRFTFYPSPTTRAMSKKLHPTEEELTFQSRTRAYSSSSPQRRTPSSTECRTGFYAALWPETDGPLDSCYARELGGGVVIVLEGAKLSLLFVGNRKK